MSPWLICFVPWLLAGLLSLFYPRAIAWISGWREYITHSDSHGYGTWGPRGYVAHPLGMRLLGAFMLASGALLIYIGIAGS